MSLARGFWRCGPGGHRDGGSLAGAAIAVLGSLAWYPPLALRPNANIVSSLARRSFKRMLSAGARSNAQPHRAAGERTPRDGQHQSVQIAGRDSSTTADDV